MAPCVIPPVNCFLTPKIETGSQHLMSKRNELSSVIMAQKEKLDYSIFVRDFQMLGGGPRSLARLFKYRLSFTWQPACRRV